MSDTPTAPINYRCAECGNPRTTRPCGCQGTAEDRARWARMAGIHRAAAELQPACAADHLADAERLEALAAGRTE